MKLREDDLEERDGNEVKRNALRERNKLWLTRVIPYEISYDLSEYVKVLGECSKLVITINIKIDLSYDDVKCREISNPHLTSL